MKKFIKICQQNLFSKKTFDLSYFDIGIIFIAFALGIYLDWTIPGSLFFAFVISIILRPLLSRQLAMVAMGFLAVLPPLIILKEFDAAEQFGVFVFYILCLTTITAIIEYKREQEA
jgi:uncharacterized membrane protein